MTTLNTMVKRVSGLAGTKDVTPWEDGFIESIVRQTGNGDDTTSLSERQVDTLEKLFEKHFAS